MKGKTTTKKAAAKKAGASVKKAAKAGSPKAGKTATKKAATNATKASETPRIRTIKSSYKTGTITRSQARAAVKAVMSALKGTELLEQMTIKDFS